MTILKQSTAATIKLGPFVDDTDGKTAETGLTISQADIRLSKNGGDIAQSHDATGATHDELGYYNVPLDATDTDTLGRLRVMVSESGALPVWQDFVVVTANVFDSLVGGGDLLDVEAPTGMALEATLTAMKGASWTDETLAALMTAIEAISAGSGASAAEVWAYAARTLTQSAAAVAAAVSGDDITTLRGDTMNVSLTGLGNLSSYERVIYTAKMDTASADTEAIIQVDNVTGLIRINGAAGTAGNGSLTVDDATLGNITIVVNAAEMATVEGVLLYDIQGITAAGVVTTVSDGGRHTITADVTRATS